MLVRTLVLLFFIFSHLPYAASHAGTYAMSRNFTVADGLPSNHIYTCVEDNHGFLWIATDAGIARFDGRTFQVFTTKQGLPDDDVLSVVKENNGRIWVNCFKQSPAYFDETRNRFINAKEDSSLAKVSGTNLIYLSALPGGGVIYNNEKGSYIFEDKKLKFFTIRPKGISNVTISYLKDGSFIALVDDFLSKSFNLFMVKNGTVTDSLQLFRYKHFMQLRYFISDDQLYIQNEERDQYFIVSGIKSSPLSCKLDSIDLGQQTIWLQADALYLHVIAQAGETMLLDKKDKSLLMKFSGNYSPNAMYCDRQGNIWISSIDKGLFLYKKKKIESVPMPAGFSNTYFLSIARKADGTLLTGNYFGQVLESLHGNSRIHKLPGSGLSSSWQRKIILSQNKVFTFSEGGSYSNFESPIRHPGNYPMSSKIATVLNDSILVEGSYGQLRTINTKTNQVNLLTGLYKRATCIYASPQAIIYHGSTDGLYKYDYHKNTDIELSRIHPLLSERITAVNGTKDGFIWVGTASSGLLQLRNDSVIKLFSAATGMISNNVKCLTPGLPGEIWVGTNEGISIIHYQQTGAQHLYENITVCDGLNSNIINEMVFSGDSVYCATSNGINILPALMKVSDFDIAVRLTRVLVNNADTVIASAYVLGYDHNFIRLTFAGIEPSGHFAAFQYKLDKGGWSDLEGNSLNLQLGSGSHTLAVRALDVNRRSSSQPLKLSFHIKIPFWKSPWTWLALSLVTGGLFVWIFRRREIAKREVSMQVMLSQKRMAELELQALKSQIDPHFIFNCLNSIKMLNHRQQYSIAENYLDRFAALLRSALEQSSMQRISLQQEIDFIENYLALEKLRFPNKLFYQVENNTGLDASSVSIPTMLLQPCIENAIKHGVGPLKDRPGIITVRFYMVENMMMAEVEDNGKGMGSDRQAGSSRGIGIVNTQRRCKLYDIAYSIDNLEDDQARSRGTVVRLKIPVNNPASQTLPV